MEDVGGGTSLSSSSSSSFVKVMTDEQMEVLRKQIAVYGTICEQLVQLHKSLTNNHNDLPAGVRLGNVYCDPLMSSGGHKISGRQRWTPTPLQLQILERIFDQGNGTPTKQKIKDITTELSQHGQISETNVYNWFQNRRARSKRKQQSNNNNDSEPDTTEAAPDSANDNKTKPEEDAQFQTTTKPVVQPIAPSFGQIPFYENMLSSNPRMEHLIGKMEVPGNYNPYMQQDDYDMAG